MTLSEYAKLFGEDSKEEEPNLNHQNVRSPHGMDVNKFINVSRHLRNYIVDHNRHHQNSPNMQYEHFPGDGRSDEDRNSATKR